MSVSLERLKKDGRNLLEVEVHDLVEELNKPISQLVRCRLSWFGLNKHICREVLDDQLTVVHVRWEWSGASEEEKPT